MAQLYNVTNPYFFNISAMDTSKVETYWYLSVVVKDEQGNPLENAKVRIYNYSNQGGNLVQMIYKQGVTDMNGRFVWPVLGGEITSTGHLFGGIIGNYYVNASYYGTESDSRGSTRSRQGSGVYVFGQNQNVDIIIPGTPDLAVGNVIQTPSPTDKNKETTITADITNVGNFTAFNVEVEMWDTNNNRLLVQDVIDVLGPGNTTKVEAKYTYKLEGNYEIKVWVDPDNKIDELNENNNVIYQFISIISRDKPDLIIVPDSLMTTPSSPISNNSKISVQATIANVGTIVAKNFNVQFYVEYLDGPGGEILLGESITILSLKPNETDVIDADVQWEVTQIGDYVVRVVVDWDDLINESYEDNNSLEIEIITVIGPDLTVTRISFDPAPPITREEKFSIKARVENVGPSDTSNFYVGFYLNTLGNLLSDPILVSISLNPGESTEVQLIITEDISSQRFGKAGQYRIFANADPDDLISETEEENNSLNVDLKIKKKADLAITDEDITFSEVQAENGVNLDISARISNIGETTTDPYTVRFFDGNVQIGPDKIETEGIEPNQNKILNVEWNSTIGGWHKIRVVILTNTPQEKTTNDIATNNIYVLTKPDLYVTPDDIRTNKDNEQALEGDEVLITVTIHNGGNTSANPFNMNIWEGPPNELGSKLIKSQLIVGLEGNSEQDRTAVHTFNNPGLRQIHVVLDPENNVDDPFPLNNTAKRGIPITETAADLTIEEEFLEIKPVVIRPDASGADQEVETNTLKHGEKYKFKLTITNLGNELAENITIKIFIDNELTEFDTINIDNITTDPLGLDNKIEIESKQAEAKYDKNFAGFHSIIISIDPDNAIKESAELNNIFTINNSYKIIKAELLVKNVEMVNGDGELVYVNEETKIKLKNGEQFFIYAYIENKGTEAANVTVKFWIDEELVWTTTPKVLILPGEEKTFTYQRLHDGSSNFNLGTRAIGLYGEAEDVEIPSNLREDPYEKPEDDEKKDDKGLFGMGPFMDLIIIILIIVIVVVCVVVGLLLLKKKREKMAECSECGALISVDANECPKCGAEFSDEIECGECGALMKVTDTTCPACGAVFAKEGEAEEGEEEGEGPPSLGAGPSVADLKAQTRSGGAPPAAAAPKPAAPGKPKPGAPGAAVAPKPAAAPTPAPTPAPKPAAAGAPEAEEEEEEKAECYRCGAIVPLSASMCPECGAEFE
jgi:subtilase family serine protease/RNA polymerase subunit RPABC4/transcription elongation factor Spt4